MLDFKCPECGCTEVVEVQGNARIVRKIKDVSCNGSLVKYQVTPIKGAYPCETYEGGEVIGYRCANCRCEVAKTSHELADKYAVKLENWCQAVGLDSIDLDVFVGDLKAKEASNINNGGMSSQLTYLLECHGNDARKVRKALAEANSIRNADGPLVKCCVCNRWALESTSVSTKDGWVCDLAICRHEVTKNDVSA